jgi:hypothetical protein
LWDDVSCIAPAVATWFGGLMCHQEESDKHWLKAIERNSENPNAPECAWPLPAQKPPRVRLMIACSLPLRNYAELTMSIFLGIALFPHELD